MSEGARSRWPWLLWCLASSLLAALLTLAMVIGVTSDDVTFIAFAIAMVLGYATVGAVLASRNPRNPIGWLLMTIGALFPLVGVVDSLVTYTFETKPGALPPRLVTTVAALLMGSWTAMIAVIVLLALLFPTGRAPGGRWRLLPPVVVVAAALALVGFAVSPGPLDTGVGIRIENPLGVDALGTAAEAIASIAFLAILLCGIGSIVSLVLRYGRADGEERQQIRWLAYVAITLATMIVAGILAGLLMGERYEGSWVSDVFFLGSFAVIAVGVPGAIGVAVLRYRLYDLDLVIKKTVVFAILVGLLTAIGGAVAVLVGIGVVPSLYDTPALLMVAGVLYGLVTIPLYRLSKRIADRVVYGSRANPYEVLTEFSERVGETYAAEDVLPRMAAVLGEATGADEATVWLRIGAELQPAATWPAGAVAPDGTPSDPVDVLHRGERLGALSVTMPPSDPMNPAKERLIRDLAGQAGLVLRNVRLIEELRASRQRLVAAQDEERRKLERNIHDGVQQQLVALNVQLGLLARTASHDAEKASELATALQTHATSTLEDLRDLARGIYPPLLADQGLGPALEAQARKAAVAATVEGADIGRYPREIEAAVYFCTLEALNNVAKYADAGRTTVRLAQVNGHLTFTVVDDGRGFDPDDVGLGTGLQGMADRLDAVGGTIRIESSPGHGATVSGKVPVTMEDAS